MVEISKAFQSWLSIVSTTYGLFHQTVIHVSDKSDLHVLTLR